MSYKTRDGKKEWTPRHTSGEKEKRRRHVSESSESDSDGSKVDVSCSSLVRYEGCIPTSSNPIWSNPISSNKM